MTKIIAFIMKEKLLSIVDFIFFFIAKPAIDAHGV